jgi:hypothetical protein
MLLKAHAKRRHHARQQKRRLTNWPTCGAGLRQRRPDRVVHRAGYCRPACRATNQPGGQPWYSLLAIPTTLTARAVFRLAWRQTAGGSVIRLPGLDLPLPDDTTAVGGWIGRAAPVRLLADSTGPKLSDLGDG